jgi:IS4 transposase
MIGQEAYDRFAQDRPVGVMVRATLENVLSAKALDTLFERTAVRQYTGTLLFSSVVDVMALVVGQVHRSPHAAYQARSDRLAVSAKAFYEKLHGIEPEVSAALVRHSGGHLAKVIDRLGGALPDLLPGYQVKIVDGNHLDATEHRIKELRTTRSGPLPGQALVVLDPSRMLALDAVVCEDGHAQERSLVPQLLEKVEGDDLWLADRNFCTTNFLFGVAERGGYFLVRQHASTLHWEPTGRQKKVGENDSGTIYEQPAVAEDKQGNPLCLRRITIKLNKPTRDGTTEIHLLTNLPKRVRAKKLTDLYLKRWTIEHAFQELATAFNAEVESLGYPKAALFAFCIGLLSYNVFSVVRAALRAQYGTEKIENEVSVYYLTEEISRSWDGINVAVPAAYWSERFGHLTPAQLASVLLCLAKNIHLRRYRKHPRGPKRPPPKRSSGKRTKHVSTARILARRRAPT